jgi:hypothetical protein
MEDGRDGNALVSNPASSAEGSHSGQLHEFRKLEGVIPTQVQILYPPLWCGTTPAKNLKNE